MSVEGWAARVSPEDSLRSGSKRVVMKDISQPLRFLVVVRIPPSLPPRLSWDNSEDVM
jgi:hypothetical protein